MKLGTSIILCILLLGCKTQSELVNIEDIYHYEAPERPSADDNESSSVVTAISGGAPAAQPQFNFNSYVGKMDGELESDTAYCKRGVSRSLLGDKDGAISDYNKAIELNPQFSIGYYNRGIAKGELNDIEGEIADYDIAVRLNPDYYIAYYNRGIAKSNLDDKYGAFADFSKAIEINPRYFEAYYNRGLVRNLLGQKKGVVDDFTKALEFNPEYVEAYYNRGIMYNELGFDDKALEDFQKTLDLLPKPLDTGAADVFFSIGLLYYDQKNYLKAEDYFTKAIEVAPEGSDLYYNRGLIRQRLGDETGACEDWKIAVSLGSNAPKAMSRICR